MAGMKSMDTNIIMMIMVNYLKGFKKLMGIRIIFYSYDGHMAYSSWYDEDTITDNGLIVTVNKKVVL